MTKIEQLQQTNDKDFAVMLKGKPREEVEMLTAWKLYADTNDVELFLNTISALAQLRGNALARELIVRLVKGARHCHGHTGQYTGDDEEVGIILSHFKFSTAIQPA